jgi:H+/Cl- antiporter ClcA
MMMPAPGAGEAAADPLAMLKTRSYVQLLVIAAIIGVPVSAVAFGFLKLVSLLQGWLFSSLPTALGFAGTPVWWPLPLLALSGLLVGLTLTYLPGTGGHLPAEGFKAGGAPTAAELPGVVFAALATLSLGVVLGPEAPLIAIGGGLGLLSVQLAKRDAPPTASIVVAAAGGFAAISTLFGSPILGAFLLMEASGLGGPMMALVLVPGLLAAGIGTLMFVGLGSLTGFGTFSLSIPGLPPFAHPTVAMFGWAIVFGLAAAALGTGIRLVALSLSAVVERRLLVLTPVAGLVVAALAIAFAEGTGRSGSEVLFSGQSALPGLVVHAAGWTIGALVLLVVCKSIAYAVSLSSFRGGPVFPSMFIGAAAGVAASHLPGLSLVPGVAMGIGAMCTVMLRLPMTSTLLATLLLASDGINVISVVIVAVVVAYVATAWLPQTPAELARWRSGPAGDAAGDAAGDPAGPSTAGAPPAPVAAAPGPSLPSGSPAGG